MTPTDIFEIFTGATLFGAAAIAFSQSYRGAVLLFVPCAIGYGVIGWWFLNVAIKL